MIPVGTLCLIVSDHGLAGRTCTVTKVAHNVEMLHRDGRWEYGDVGYLIDVPSVTTPRGHRAIGALPRHLIPLAPPAPIESTEREVETC